MGKMNDKMNEVVAELERCGIKCAAQGCEGKINTVALVADLGLTAPWCEDHYDQFARGAFDSDLRIDLPAEQDIVSAVVRNNLSPRVKPCPR